MLNLFRNFKQCFFVCLLIKIYVAEYSNNITNDNFAFSENASALYDQKEVNNQTEYHDEQDSDEENYNVYFDPCYGNVENKEINFNFSKTFSEENITDLIQFLYENSNRRICEVHNKTVRVDCENVFFTTVRLERLGENRMKLECTEEIRPNAINVCIKQKASMKLAEAYKPIEPGSIVKMNLFPHMVAIGYPPNKTHPIEGVRYSFECGGSLITDKYVLTAAHCFKNQQPVVLRLGINDLVEPTHHVWLEEAVDVNILKIHSHPLYNIKRKYYDIALIELENPVPLSLAIYPACLDTDNDTMAGTELYVTGWGLTEETKQSYNLKYAVMATISRSECTAKYRKYGLKNVGIPNGVLESQICAGNFTSKIIDTCAGDSGGPFLSGPGYGFVSTIHGITSFGFRCGTDPPSIFTKVSYYRDWIESIVWPKDQ